MSKLSSLYICGKTKFSMQFLADTVKQMCKENLLTEKDLYELSEKEIIEKIEKCEHNNISKRFRVWENATNINESDVPIHNKYCVNLEKVKIRYINPLVKLSDKNIRINEISEKAKNDIEKALNFKTKKYAYLDF